MQGIKEKGSVMLPGVQKKAGAQKKDSVLGITDAMTSIQSSNTDSVPKAVLVCSPPAVKSLETSKIITSQILMEHIKTEFDAKFNDETIHRKINELDLRKVNNLEVALKKLQKEVKTEIKKMERAEDKRKRSNKVKKCFNVKDECIPSSICVCATVGASTGGAIAVRTVLPDTILNNTCLCCIGSTFGAIYGLAICSAAYVGANLCCNINCDQVQKDEDTTETLSMLKDFNLKLNQKNLPPGVVRAVTSEGEGEDNKMAKTESEESLPIKPPAPPQ